MSNSTGRLVSFATGLDRLVRYQRSWLRADLLGGLTVGAMLIPQSMAYAELAGMPPRPEQPTSHSSRVSFRVVKLAVAPGYLEALRGD